MATFVIPPEYGYVLATVSASAIVNYFHGFLTGRIRKAAKVDYPAPYANHEEALKDPAKWAFNCAQRAHVNYLENLPTFFTTMLIGGLRFPLAMTAMGVIWLVNRVIYAIGYKNSPIGGTGTGRYKGAAAMLVQLPMTLVGLYAGYDLACSAFA